MSIYGHHACFCDPYNFHTKINKKIMIRSTLWEKCSRLGSSNLIRLTGFSMIQHLMRIMTATSKLSSVKHINFTIIYYMLYVLVGLKF